MTGTLILSRRRNSARAELEVMECEVPSRGFGSNVEVSSGLVLEVLLDRKNGSSHVDVVFVVTGVSVYV